MSDDAEMTWAEIGDHFGVSHVACIKAAQLGIRKLWRRQVRPLRVGSIRPERRTQVHALRAKGLKHSEIAQRLGMAQSSVSRILAERPRRVG